MPVWTTISSLRHFSRAALEHPDNFLYRYGWEQSHTRAEVDSIYAEVISKIPAGATKVLELGSGDGSFYRALKAARPTLGYTGVDIVSDNITDATTAKGTIAVAGALTGDTVTIGTVVLTASGAQGPAGLNFSEVGTDIEVATSLVAAINDPGNAVPATAANAGGTSATVTVWADAPGVTGDLHVLASSDGVRLAVSGANLTGGVDAGVFELGNAWEYLQEATVDWDFVVSINCLFACTETAAPLPVTLLELLNAKASKGFFILGDSAVITPALLTRFLAPIIAESVVVTESYYEGARVFLDGLLTKQLHPIYVHRDSTPAVAPETLPRSCQPIATGKYNAALGRDLARREIRKGNVLPTTFTGITYTAGRITGSGVVPIDAAWTRGILETP